MTFEEGLSDFNEVLVLYKSRWTLADYSFQDLSQDIRIHACKKWHLYDQTKPLKPWAARLISNFIKNELRNRYYIYQSPCLKCEFFLGDGQCKMYKVCSSKCGPYKNFMDKKGQAAGLYFPVSYEQSNYDAVQQFTCSSSEFANSLGDMLSGIHKQIFHLFYASGFSTTKIARSIKISGQAFKGKMNFIEDSLSQTKEIARELIEEKKIVMGLDYDR